jgi:hypothetical protein
MAHRGTLRHITGSPILKRLWVLEPPGQTIREIDGRPRILNEGWGREGVGNRPLMVGQFRYLLD